MAPLSIVWFCAITVASLALPGYQGTISTAPLVPLYAVLAASVGLLVRGRADSLREAMLSAIPAVAVITAAAVAGLLRNQALADGRGEPLYLYVAIALWVSWTMLVIAGAAFSRAKWSGAGAITLTAVVSIVGWFLFTLHLD